MATGITMKKIEMILTPFFFCMILRVRYDTMTMFDRVWPEVDFGGLINMGAVTRCLARSCQARSID